MVGKITRYKGSVSKQTRFEELYSNGASFEEIKAALDVNDQVYYNMKSKYKNKLRTELEKELGTKLLKNKVQADLVANSFVAATVRTNTDIAKKGLKDDNAKVKFALGSTQMMLNLGGNNE